VCGIAGIAGAEDPALVRAMLGRIANRGPDGEATWSDTAVTLGHRRLAIVDLATGQQPMTDASGRYTIVYNGEAYNHLELRAELEGLGHAFRTRSDTEAVLEGWARWGRDVLRRIEGMFAFALWDAQLRRLWLARDRWGIKPLHVARVEGALLFASEAKAFGAHPAFAFRIDPVRARVQAVLEHLYPEGSLFAGVEAVPPGTCLEHDASGRLLRVTGRPALPIEVPPSPEAAAEAVAQALAVGVREQLMAEVPVGTVLSGGLDSAAVAAAHQAAAGGTIDTFTVADAEEVPDFEAARRVAQELGTRHHERVFTHDEAVAALPRFAWHQENSDYTESFFWHLFELARPHVTVALSGQGADELWGGYARHRDPAGTLQARLARLAAAGLPRPVGWAQRLAEWHASGADLARHDQRHQLDTFQLRLVDRASMAHGLEVRVPMLSRRLQSLSNGIPWAWKLQDGVEKRVLRHAARRLGVPRAIAERPKLPAGRATGPSTWERFEAEAARRYPARRLEEHALAGLATPAQALMHDLLVAVHEQGADPRKVRVEDLL
jgi:asparagine synthase (glutamine-hydrolysing)